MSYHLERRCAIDVINPLLGLDLSAEEIEAGARWYSDYATRIVRIGRRYGYADRLTLAAFAALSPRMTVRGNVQMLYRCIVAHHAGLKAADVNRAMPGKTGSGAMRNRVECAFRALDGDVRSAIKAIKVRSFYLNLRGRSHEVTIDTWAAQPFGHAPGAKFGRPDYRHMRSCYREAALVLGVSPSTYQAATWIHLRGKAN